MKQKSQRNEMKLEEGGMYNLSIFFCLVRYLVADFGENEALVVAYIFLVSIRRELECNGAQHLLRDD